MLDQWLLWVSPPSLSVLVLSWSCGKEVTLSWVWGFWGLSSFLVSMSLSDKASHPAWTHHWEALNSEVCGDCERLMGL